MSGKTFAQELAEKCVTTHVVNGQPTIRLRTRDAVAVISSPHGSVHGAPGTELECVRTAVAGYVEAGIEEGEKKYVALSCSLIEAAREEGRQAGHQAGIAVGWARALAVAVRQAEAREEGVELAKRELGRSRDELRAAEMVRDAITEAMPGEDR